MMSVQRLFPRTTYARRIARDVLPGVAVALSRWQRRAQAIPNVELRKQAWASISAKRFHAEGGGVFAALAPEWTDTLVPLIVALQTISDYLDNLCDRSVSMDEKDFRQLHKAMSDAVDGTPPMYVGSRNGEQSETSPPYYDHHPNKDDGSYLRALVDECRHHIDKLPSYAIVRPYVLYLVELYSDLQVYKHGPVAGRRQTLERWFAEKGSHWSRLHWFEFAAATGSTLGMFALFTAATRTDLTDAEADAIVNSYFPWICGWHILLDYLIDQEEDIRGGDLNFVSFYDDGDHMRRRLVLFANKARSHARTLPDAAFHTTVVQGLPGLYLSDAKVGQQRMQRLARTLLRASGPASFAYYVWCRLRRIVEPD